MLTRPKIMFLASSSSSSSEYSAQGQVPHCKHRNLGCNSAEGRSSTANSGTKAVVLPEIDRCGSFPLLSVPHSLFSIRTVLKISEKIPGAPTWRWGEEIWLTAHSPSFPSLHLRHSSLSNPSVALPTSQLILQPFRCFTYVTAHSQTIFRFYLTGSSLTSLGELPMLIQLL